MKKLVHKSAIIILAGLLIMATGGYSIYEHFCHCAGEKTASIFPETTCIHECAPAGEAGSCCAAKDIPSCCKSKVGEQEEKACHGNDCCQTSSLFIKISDNFNISLEKTSLKFEISYVQVLNTVDVQIEPAATFARAVEFYDTSPPLYGRELINHLHQLKIAYFLV